MAIETVQAPVATSSLPNAYERAFDVLSSDPLRMLTYLAIVRTAKPLTGLEQARQIRRLQGHEPSVDDNEFAKETYGHCRRTLCPSGFVLLSPHRKGHHHAEAFEANPDNAAQGFAVGGMLLDLRLQFPTMAQTDMLGQIRFSAGRGMPLTATDIFGLLLKHPRTPLTLAQIRTPLGREKPVIHRTLSVLHQKEVLRRIGDGYQIADAFRPPLSPS
jgi:hypothetical protein